MRLYEVTSPPKEQLLRDASKAIGYDVRLPSLSPFGDRAIEEAVKLFNKNGGEPHRINSLLTMLEFCSAPVKFSGLTNNDKIYFFIQNSSFKKLKEYGDFPLDFEIRDILMDNIKAGENDHIFTKVDRHFQKFARATHSALGYIDTLRSTVKFSEKSFSVAVAKATMKELGVKYAA